MQISFGSQQTSEPWNVRLAGVSAVSDPRSRRGKIRTALRGGLLLTLVCGLKIGLPNSPAHNASRMNAKNKLRICVDLLFLQPQRNRGTETYAKELLRRLEEMPSVELTLMLNRSTESEFRSFIGSQRRVIAISGRNRVFRVLYQQIVLPRLARRNGAQVQFCPGYLSPVRPLLPTVVSIHDVQF